MRPGEGDLDSTGDVGDGGDALGADGSPLPRLLGTSPDVLWEDEANTSASVTGVTGMETFGRTPKIESIWAPRSAAGDVASCPTGLVSTTPGTIGVAAGGFGGDTGGSIHGDLGGVGGNVAGTTAIGRAASAPGRSLYLPEGENGGVIPAYTSCGVIASKQSLHSGRGGRAGGTGGGGSCSGKSGSALVEAPGDVPASGATVDGGAAASAKDELDVGCCIGIVVGTAAGDAIGINPDGGNISCGQRVDSGISHPQCAKVTTVGT